MIRHMFVFGVIVPTVITVAVFVVFLVCWFKFNIKERFLSKHFFKKQQLHQGLSPKTPDKAPASVIYKRESWDGHGKDGHDPGGNNHKRDPRDPDDDPQGRGQGSLGYCNDAMSHSRPSSGCPDDRDTVSQCSIDDSEADLCPQKKDSANYFHNPNMAEGDSMGEPGQRLLAGCESPGITRDRGPNLSCRRCGHKGVKMAPTADSSGGMGQTMQFADTDTEENNLIQQTFHFPVSDTNQLHCLTMDMTEEESADEDSNYGHFIPKCELLAQHTLCTNLTELDRPPHKLDNGTQQASPSRIYTGGSPGRGGGGGAGLQGGGRGMELQLKHWQQALRHKKLQSQHAVAGVRFSDQCTAAVSNGYSGCVGGATQPCSAQSAHAPPTLTYAPSEEHALVM